MLTLQNFFISLGFSWMIYPYFIRFLQRHNHQQSVSEYALDAFKEKAKTPTMGGVVFVVVPLLTVLIFNTTFLVEPKIQLLLISYFVYGAIGFADDLKILIEKDNKGLSASFKFFLQLVFAFVIYYLFRDHFISIISVPFTSINFNIGPLYVMLVIVMLSGASNGVNLTDGMDGLAVGTSLIALSGFAYIAYLNLDQSILVFILSVMGSLVAFLIFNFHPAKIFMGDVGSLPLGALLASLAIVMKLEFILLFLGAVFVIETLCVMLQIFWVKVFKKRLFRYTPIHYSFTLAGYKELHVVLGFYLFCFISVLIGVWAALV